MKLSKKMLKELVADVVKERLDGAPRTYPTEEERYQRDLEQGLIPAEGEEIEYQRPRDPLEEIAELKREIKKINGWNLALINQLTDLGQAPVRTVVHTDPDVDPKADTVRRKK